MRPDIKKDVFHLNWAPEAVPADSVGIPTDSYYTVLNVSLYNYNNLWALKLVSVVSSCSCIIIYPIYGLTVHCSFP